MSLVITEECLNLLGVKFDSKPHAFIAAERDESKNVRLMIQGIIFQDNDGQNIFATPLFLPKEIVSFISQKGYRLLQLTRFSK